jgi:hypothetical protein
MMSVGATIGEKGITRDAVRAYLNAEVLDPNLSNLPDLANCTALFILTWPWS